MKRINVLKFLTTGALAFAIAGCSTANKNQPPPAVEPPVEAPAKALPPPPPEPEPELQKFVIDGVNFDFNKFNLTPSAVIILDDAVRVLNSHPSVRYEVAGHTDSVGSDSYNQGLSEQRANAVRDYLVDRGVSPSQLVTRGYGESQPVAPNDNDSGRAQNRRVELLPLQ
jgi:OOP family OmpA-OmpF porin